VGNFYLLSITIGKVAWGRSGGLDGVQL
jgi:hypothetical protein